MANKTLTQLLSLNLVDDNLEDLDKIKLLYTLSNNTEKNYKIIKIKKRRGSTRTLYAPNSNLKQVQKNILKNILEKREVSSYAKAYKKDCKLIDNATMHINKKIILKLDIENFFDNISFMNIYNKVFSLKYFPKNIGIMLTYLCTYNDYLPQGAPTSPYISNLILYDFDEEIGDWCNNLNIAYSRYSDDLTFSGDFKPSIVITKVQKLLNQLELKLNYSKTVIVSNNKRQLVTGIVVNKKCQIAKEYRKKIRQEMYFIKKYGIDNHLNRVNIKSKKKYLLSLLGKVNYVYSVTKKKEYKDYLYYLKNLIK